MKIRNVFTLKEILEIASEALYASINAMNKETATNKENMEHSMRYVLMDLNIAMKRIRWHLLKLEPGPSSYRVIGIA